MSENLELKAISDLKDYTFTIPYQQRGYRWTEDNINKLLDDLKEFVDDSGKSFYYLQPIAVVKEDNAQNSYSVIDGQQRLTTLYLLHKYLTSDKENLTADTEFFNYEYDRDNAHERSEFLRKIISKDDNSKIDFYYISHAYKTIKDWFEERPSKNEASDEEKNRLKDKIRKLLVPTNETCKSVQIIWYLVEKEKAHETFRNINSGKIQLSNSDLIKALLLNRDDGIKNKEQIAAQFEIMQRQFSEDRFWYMLKSSDVDPQKGQSRMDLIFNLVTGIKDGDYQADSRKSFYKFSLCKKEELEKKWKEARDEYQRLKDLFDDPYTFHYVGFLVYCEKEIKKLLDEMAEKSKSEYRNYLKNEIKNNLKLHEKIEDYSYDDDKKYLRRLFVLHNIETILHRYESLKESRNLRFSFEYFPFELLYTQRWHIEHIASHTDNDLKSDKDKLDWVESISEDYVNILSQKTYKKLTALKTNFQAKKDEFDNIYNEIIHEIEDMEGITPLDEDEKNSIGNLVLLDDHTNTSFHNSLFPRKRKIVIIASGLRNKDEDVSKTNIKSVYVPICTQQVYTKSYNKQSNVKLNSWGKDDCDAYLRDMKERLAYYFVEKKK